LACDGVASALRRLADWLALERNVAVMALAILVITMGEEMWAKFVPKHLRMLGAEAAVVGLYGSLKLRS